MKERRIVHDSLGQMEIPADAYYGAQTARALRNFPISGLRLPPIFVEAQALIKWAAAKAHAHLHALSPELAAAICQAADEVIAGQWNQWFQVDIYQAGAGTSQNMNVNEVIATRASEILRGTREEPLAVHPNDHVNKSQSTNDTIHAAMNLSMLLTHQRLVDPSLAILETTLAKVAHQAGSAVKAGRTHLQDAVPMRIADSFLAYAENIRRHRVWLNEASSALAVLGLGGNAVGTGINTPPGFAEQAITYLAERTQLPLCLPVNPFTFNQNPDEVVYYGNILQRTAEAIGRIANDLRLLASGPRTGLAEIEFPAVQPGSSIMPGKVNPVMAEMMNMVVFQVQGCQSTIALAGSAGQLELNVMMPVMAANALHAMTILANAVKQFAEQGVAGLILHTDVSRHYAESSLSLATALNVAIGYERAAAVVHQALINNCSLLEAGQQLGLDSHLLQSALDIDRLAVPVSRYLPKSRSDMESNHPTTPEPNVHQANTNWPETGD